MTENKNTKQTKINRLRKWFAESTTSNYDLPPKIKEMPPPKTKKIPVQVMDIDMPFMSMVFFMVKWAFATIPAIIIIYIIIASIPVILSSFF